MRDRHFVRAPTAPIKQRGVALIIVMFIAALVTVLVAGMLNQQFLFIQKTGNMLTMAQAHQFSLGAEEYARQLLKRDFDQDKKNNKMIDHAEEFWNKNSAVFPIDGGAIEVQLDDLQGRFNLNSLVDENGKQNATAIKWLKKLLDDLAIESITVEKVVDWIDPDDQQFNYQGAEDSTYLGKDPPYRAANTYMQSITELMLIDGMTQKDYDLLRDFVTVLPVGVKQLNINSAGPEVISILSDKLTKKAAESIIQQRGEDGFATVADFLAANELSGLGNEVKSDTLTVSSEYFRLIVATHLADRTSRLVSIIYRDKEGKLTVLSRDQGLGLKITKPKATL